MTIDKAVNFTPTPLEISSLPKIIAQHGLGLYLATTLLAA